MSHMSGPASETSVSVVIPCYRSETTLPPLVDQLIAELAPITCDLEVLLVVDGSPDQTWQVAAELADRWGPVEALRLSRNFGQHNALLAGIRRARHEVIVTMDDDLQHRPDQIALLLDALGPGVDLVYGVAIDGEHGLARNLASSAAKWGIAAAAGVRQATVVSAFRAFRSSLRAGWSALDGPHPSIDVALAWTTTNTLSVPVIMEQRRVGRSNYRPRDLIQQAVNLTLGYSTAPLRFVVYLGFATGLFGLALLAWVLWAYISGTTKVAGFTSIASMISVFSGAQLISLGVLGEYVARIFARGAGQPSYVISEVTGLSSPEDPSSHQVPRS